MNVKSTWVSYGYAIGWTLIIYVTVPLVRAFQVFVYGTVGKSAFGYFVLVAELRKHGFTGSYLPAFLDEMKRINNPVALEMAEAYLALGLINEALAVFLEEVFLKELGFDPKGYIDLKKEFNPYCEALEKRGKEGMLRYIKDWHRPEYYGTSFVKTFLSCFQKIKVDKFTTRWEKTK